MGLVFLISNFFNNKTSLTIKWMRKKIPSCSNLANRQVTITKKNCLIYLASCRLYITSLLCNLLLYSKGLNLSVQFRKNLKKKNRNMTAMHRLNKNELKF